MASRELCLRLVDPFGPEMAVTVFQVGTRMAEADWHCAWEWLQRGPFLCRYYHEQGQSGLWLRLCEDKDPARPFHPRFFLTLLEKALEVYQLLGEEEGEKALDLVRTMALEDAETARAFVDHLPEKIRLLIPTYPLEQIYAFFRVAASLSNLTARLIPPFFEVLSPAEGGWDPAELAELPGILKDTAEISLHLAEGFLKTLPALRRQGFGMEVRALLLSLHPLARRSWETAVKVMNKLPALYPLLPGEHWEGFVRLVNALTVEGGGLGPSFYRTVSFLDRRVECIGRRFTG